MHRIARFLLVPLAAATLTGAVAAGPDPAPRPSSGLAVFPATLHCPARADAPVERDVWLVNRATHAVRLRGAAPTCGCTNVDDLTDVTLAPGRAHRVRVRINPTERTTPRKPVQVRFDTEWGAPAVCRVEFDATSPASPGSTSSPPDSPPDTDLCMLTEGGALGDVTPEIAYETAVWLVNDGPEARSIDRIQAGCGCTTVIGFAPTVLEPGAAIRVRMVVTPSARKIGAKHVSVRALGTDGRPLAQTRLEMNVVAAAVADVE